MNFALFLYGFVFSVSCLFLAVKNKDVKCKFNQVYCLAGTEWSRNCSQYQRNDMTKDYQINIGSKDFVIETRTLKMMRIVDIFLLMMTTNWGHYQSVPTKNISRFCRITKHSILHQIGKSKKLNKWVLHKPNKTKKNLPLWNLFCTFLCNRNVPFFDCILICNKNRSYMTSDSILCSDWTEVNHQNIFPNQSCSKRSLWSHFGGW